MKESDVLVEGQLLAWQKIEHGLKRSMLKGIYGPNEVGGPN